MQKAKKIVVAACFGSRSIHGANNGGASFLVHSNQNIKHHVLFFSCSICIAAPHKGHCIQIYGITTTQGKPRLLKITRKKSHKNLWIALTATGKKCLFLPLSLSILVGYPLLFYRTPRRLSSPFRSTNFGMFPLIRTQHHWIIFELAAYNPVTAPIPRNRTDVCILHINAIRVYNNIICI